MITEKDIMDRMKNAMMEFKDFHGGELSKLDAVKDAKTKDELLKIIDAHSDFLENVARDAQSHLERFKRRLRKMED